MDFFETVNRRFSCRNYADRPVEKEKLLACLEAARRAPSSRNSQPCRYVVVNGGEPRTGLIKYTKIEGFNQFADQCGTFVVLYGGQAEHDPRTGKPPPRRAYWQTDIGIAAAYFTLAAAAQGLATCIIGYFEEKPLRELLGIPEDKQIWLILAVGYAKAEPKQPTPRKPLEELVRFLP
jgi:nitroreductase